MNIIYEKRIKTENIVVSPRPVWKCTTCEFYGKRPSCPPFTPNWKDAKEWIGHYSYALFIKFEVDMKNFEDEKRKIIEYLLTKEKELFEEYPFVFALFPGACNICEDCPFEKTGKCVFPTKSRPSMDAVGIELSSIVKINYQENVLYSLVLLE